MGAQRLAQRSKTISCDHMEPFSTLQFDFYWFCEWCSAAKNSPRRPRLGIQAVIRVVKRTAKPRAHGSFPAAVAGRPHSDDPATAPVRAERPKVIP